MKLSLIALFFGFSAQALDFVPELCSRTATQSVAKVCIGKIAELNTDGVLQVTLTGDGSERLYSTNLRVGPTGMGPNNFDFDGNLLILKMNDSIAGVLRVVSGITVSYSLDFETDTGLMFNGPLYRVP